MPQDTARGRCTPDALSLANARRHQSGLCAVVDAAQGYVDLLQTIAQLDLVENVAPIQLAVRLLLPAGKPGAVGEAESRDSR